MYAQALGWNIEQSAETAVQLAQSKRKKPLWQACLTALEKLFETFIANNTGQSRGRVSVRVAIEKDGKCSSGKSDKHNLNSFWAAEGQTLATQYR